MVFEEFQTGVFCSDTGDNRTAEARETVMYHFIGDAETCDSSPSPMLGDEGFSLNKPYESGPSATPSGRQQSPDDEEQVLYLVDPYILRISHNNQYERFTNSAADPIPEMLRPIFDEDEVETESEPTSSSTRVSSSLSCQGAYCNSSSWSDSEGSSGGPRGFLNTPPDFFLSSASCSPISSPSIGLAPRVNCWSTISFQGSTPPSSTSSISPPPFKSLPSPKADKRLSRSDLLRIRKQKKLNQAWEDLVRERLCTSEKPGLINDGKKLLRKTPSSGKAHSLRTPYSDHYGFELRPTRTNIGPKSTASLQLSPSFAELQKARPSYPSTVLEKGGHSTSAIVTRRMGYDSGDREQSSGDEVVYSRSRYRPERQRRRSVIIEDEEKHPLALSQNHGLLATPLRNEQARDNERQVLDHSPCTSSYDNYESGRSWLDDSVEYNEEQEILRDPLLATSSSSCPPRKAFYGPPLQSSSNSETSAEMSRPLPDISPSFLPTTFSAAAPSNTKSPDNASAFVTPQKYISQISLASYFQTDQLSWNAEFGVSTEFSDWGARVVPIEGSSDSDEVTQSLPASTPVAPLHPQEEPQSDLSPVPPVAPDDSKYHTTNHSSLCGMKALGARQSRTTDLVDDNDDEPSLDTDSLVSSRAQAPGLIVEEDLPRLLTETHPLVQHNTVPIPLTTTPASYLDCSRTTYHSLTEPAGLTPPVTMPGATQQLEGNRDISSFQDLPPLLTIPTGPPVVGVRSSHSARGTIPMSYPPRVRNSSESDGGSAGSTSETSHPLDSLLSRNSITDSTCAQNISPHSQPSSQGPILSEPEMRLRAKATSIPDLHRLDGDSTLYLHSSSPPASPSPPESPLSTTSGCSWSSDDPPLSGLKQWLRNNRSVLSSQGSSQWSSFASTGPPTVGVHPSFGARRQIMLSYLLRHSVDIDQSY